MELLLKSASARGRSGSGGGGEDLLVGGGLQSRRFCKSREQSNTLRFFLCLFVFGFLFFFFVSLNFRSFKRYETFSFPRKRHNLYKEKNEKEKKREKGKSKPKNNHGPEEARAIRGWYY
jgi:hypothetical protein